MKNAQTTNKEEPRVEVSFRGVKVEERVTKETTVEVLKTTVIKQLHEQHLSPADLKLLWRGKVLSDNETTLYDLLSVSGRSVHRIVATGVSSAEKLALEEESVRHQAVRVRDDLSEAGILQTAQRQRLGRRMLAQAASNSSSTKKYGFGRIEVLRNLPDQQRAKTILTQLANDPGILACMAKHQWQVGSLTELMPDGQVGQSAVCVMGLNRNKGQQILLRIRTDDLLGFRKPLSIRKVLYHELAHNVHSEHDEKFFQLMRQVERECTDLDWTRGAGLSTKDPEADRFAYTGGAYRLGGSASGGGDTRQSRREVAARAAVSRMTAEEEEIEQNCGCGRQDLFLADASSKNDNSPEDDGMDTSE